MTDTSLLHRLKGRRSQAEWADALGVTQTLVSFWLAGGAIGVKGQAALIRLHPDHRDAIVEEVLRRQEPQPTPTDTTA